jgi:glycine/D-amino acid oxidase-like deaminating enzyme
MQTGHVSFWYDTLPIPRPPLDGDTSADVCIIGAGYTGLWTAWYLKQAQPDLNILIVEKHFAGFGASGRNGGWLTGGFAWNHERYLSRGPEGVRAMVAAMNGTVDEVVRETTAQGIDADIHRTDELMVATSAAQLSRLQAEVATRRRWGEDRVHAIGAEVQDRIAIPGAVGAMVVQGVARIQPAKLVQGLAAACVQAGVRIVEGTTVTSISKGAVTTDRGIVRAETMIRATEGFTAQLPGHRRDWLPLNSAQIVTDPVPDDVWQKIGWKNHELIGDFANAYCYCQRTADNRITVGARGVPYKFASRLDDNGTPDAETIRRLTAILRRHFPAASHIPIAHAWCGVLGVPRDWCATVGFDPATGIGFAGGYVGVGVSTSNLAGRTLTDLILRRDTALTTLPWVNHKVRKWEPEPLRWLGVRAMYALLNAADRAEARGARPSRLAKIASSLMGR